MIKRKPHILPVVLFVMLFSATLYVAARTAHSSPAQPSLVGFVAATTAGFTATPATAPKMPRDILGVELNMSEEAAERQLKKAGFREREEGEEEEQREEIWAVKDPRFSHVVVGFDEHGVRYITAVARAESTQKMRYSDAGDTNQAQQKGDPQRNNFHYVWESAANGKQPHYLVVARGRDTQYLETFSLKRL